MSKKVANPGSALGEAIGKLVEEKVKEIINEKFIRKHPEFKLESGKMSSNGGVSYDIDLIIKHKDGNPVALIEVKFLRYKKHMRDKGSWIANTFTHLRRSYPTITYTLAILLGDWTKGSKKMLTDSGVDIIEIPFSHIVNVLKKHGVLFDWGEKELDKAREAWETFSSLPEDEKKDIASEILKNYEKKIVSRLESKIIKDVQKEKLSDIIIIARSNIGREIVFRCRSVSECESFLNELRKVESGEKKVNELALEMVDAGRRRTLFDY